MARTRWQTKAYIEAQVQTQNAKKEIDNLARHTEQKMTDAARHISLASPDDNWLPLEGGGGGGSGGRGTSSSASPKSVEDKRKKKETERFWGKNGVVARMFRDSSNLLSGSLGRVFDEFVSEAQDWARQYQEMKGSRWLNNQYEHRLETARFNSSLDYANRWGDIGKEFGIGGWLIGASLGRAYGWAKGQTIESDKIWKEIQERNLDLTTHRQERHFGRARSMSDWGLEGLLERSGSRELKIGYIDQMMRRIHSGKGDWSINSLKRQLQIMGPDAELSEEGQMLRRRLEAQQDRYYELQMRKQQLKLSPMIPFQSGSDYADEYARKGLYVGAQVDVTDINREILGQLKIITEVLRKASNNPYETGIFNEFTSAYLR